MAVTELIRSVMKAGANICFVGRYGADGYLTNFDGTDVVNGDQDGNGGIELFPLVKAVPPSVPENESVPITGDDGTADTFQFEPATLPELVATFGQFDLTHHGILQGTNTKGYGYLNFGLGMPDEPEYPKLMMLVQSKAKVWRPATSRSEPLYAAYLLLSIQMTPLHADNVEERTPHTDQYKITSAQSPYTPWGETICDDYGSPSAVFLEYHGPYRIHVATFRGNGVETTFNLPYTPAAADGNHNIVYVNRTVQAYTVNYTISIAASTITFVAAPALGDAITVVYSWDETC